MRPPIRLCSAFYRPCLRIRRATRPQRQVRPIATHTSSHQASAISILPSNVDKSSNDYTENARHMGQVMARMEELHRKIEEGGPTKSREKHIARGKMLPREYILKGGIFSILGLTCEAQPSHSTCRCWKPIPRILISCGT